MTYEGYLPISKEDMWERKISQLDFVYVCGDAYVDHPSFGHAIITRLLEAHGYTVGIIAQPDWKDDTSISILGEPRLGFLVSAGNMDSMVNHYSVSKHRRDYDNYSPGGKIGLRPDYATVVYCNLIRHTYKKKPIIIGGIEASLRRLAHYDYWSNKVRRSILLDSGADLISYGMGERSVIEIADCLASGMDVKDITNAVGHAASTLADDINARALLAVTQSGFTARRVSKFRPNVEIIGATPTEKAFHQLSLEWGVQPLKTEHKDRLTELFRHCADKAMEKGMIQDGDLVVITAGVPIGRTGDTNMIRVMEA